MHGAQGTEPGRAAQGFAQRPIDNRKDIQRFGCPVGRLCAEPAKLERPLQDEAAFASRAVDGWAQGLD
jgi:hypothetical protein